MKKDETITILLGRLKQEMNFALIEVVDFWETDLCAIGLKVGNKLAYISTYNFIGKKPCRYDYEFELIEDSKVDDIHVLKKGRGVTERELIYELEDFFQEGR
jgi:hypothetical protein